MISQKLMHQVAWLRARAAKGQALDAELIGVLADHLDDLADRTAHLEASWIAPRARRESPAPLPRNPYAISLSAQRCRRIFTPIKGGRT